MRSVAYLFAALILLIGPGAPEVHAQSEALRERFDELRRLDTDQALQQLQAEPAGPALDLAASLGQYAEQRGDFRRADAMYAYAQRLAEQGDNQRLVGVLLYRRAEVQFRINRSSVPSDLLEESASVFQAIGMTTEHVAVLSRLANMYDITGHLRDALAAYERILDEAAAVDDPDLLGGIYVDALMIQYKTGDLNQIDERIARARELFTETMNLNGLGMVHKVEGNVHMARRQWIAAIASFEAAGDYFEQTGNVHERANVMFNMAVVYTGQSQHQQSTHYARRAISLFTDAGSAAGAGMAGALLGRNLHALGDYHGAQAVLLVSVDQLRSASSKFRLAGALETLADTLVALDDQSAVDVYEQAVEVFEEIGDAAAAARIRRKAREQSGP